MPSPLARRLDSGLSLARTGAEKDDDTEIGCAIRPQRPNPASPSSKASSIEEGPS
jgi:hypothetical protein